MVDRSVEVSPFAADPKQAPDVLVVVGHEERHTGC